jgi:hypothetical protein
MLFGTYMHLDYDRWNKRGREAYLKQQGHRYDTYMANPAPFYETALFGVSAVGLLTGLYEGLALTFLLLLKDVVPDSRIANRNNAP